MKSGRVLERRNHQEKHSSSPLSERQFARSILLIILTLAVSVTAGYVFNPIQTHADSSFIFAASGDLGVSSYSNTSLMLLSSLHPSFFLALGDLSYESAQMEATYCKYVTSRVGLSLPFEILSGNHEDGTEQHNGLIDNFAKCLPDKLGVTGTYGKEYYFDFPAQNPLARFILISPGLTFTSGGQYSYTVGSPHYQWLSNTIDSGRAAGIPWVIVGMHKVCISMGEHSCEVGPDVMNLLLSKRVDLILEGHEHSYQRTKQLTCIGNPTFMKNATFDPSCISNDGSTGSYNKGSGSVIVISGAFGGGAPSPANSLDPEAQYFATGMGDTYTLVKGQPSRYVGEVWNSGSNGTGKGFVEYTLSTIRLDAQLLLPSQITPGTLFSDKFSIVKGGSTSSSQTGSNSGGSGIPSGTSPLDGYLVLGALATPSIYVAWVYLRDIGIGTRFRKTLRSRIPARAAYLYQVAAGVGFFGRMFRRLKTVVLGLLDRR